MKRKERRKIRIFPVYHHDAAFLLRLAESVEKDETMDAQWRKETSESLRSLSARFREVIKGK